MSRAVAIDIANRGWVVAGGWEEPGRLVLRVAVVRNEDVEHVLVEIPISLNDAGELEIGEPTQTEGGAE